MNSVTLGMGKVLLVIKDLNGGMHSISSTPKYLRETNYESK